MLCSTPAAVVFSRCIGLAMLAISGDRNLGACERHSDASRKAQKRQGIDRIGGPDRIRTCDPQFRKLMLYPAELRDPRGAFF